MPRNRNIRLPRSGTYYSRQFDSEISGSQWHRIVLEATVPDTGRIIVQVYTSDRVIDDSELAGLDWSAPFVISTDRGFTQPELLIQSGAGRYLRIKIDLLGDGRSTPEIRSLLLFGPRESSLHYLPPPFHQDAESRYFLDRLLSYFDTVQEEIRFLIRDFTRYLDPYGVPAGAFLDWLGQWFDWQFYAQWPDALRREMLANSIEFFQRRGTVAGIKQMLQWHTGLSGEQPQIIEHFRLAAAVDRQQDEACPLFIGEKPLLTEHRSAHWFTVVLPVSAVPNAEAQRQIKQLITAQKPAHTAFQLCIFNPGVRIAKQSTIGVDTWLGHYPQAPLGDMIIGQSANLAAPPRGLQIGRQILS